MPRHVLYCIKQFVLLVAVNATSGVVMQPYRIYKPSEGYYKELAQVGSVNGRRRIDRMNGQTFVKQEMKRSKLTKLYSTNTYGIIETVKRSYDGDNLTPEIYVPSVLTSPSMYIDPSVWIRLEEICQEKLYGQMRNNSNLIVDLAEMPSTIKMLKSALNLKKFVVDFFKTLFQGSRFKRRKARDRNRVKRYDDVVQYASGKWLECRYGWMPLVGSLYDAADNLYREVMVAELAFKARASVKFEKPIVRPHNVQGQSETLITQQCRREVNYVFKRSQNDPSWAMKWTSLNPALIAYELMTLSFVLDWFVNIGSQLEAWENWTLFTRHFVRGCRTNTVSELVQANYAYGFVRKPSYWPNGQIIAGHYLGELVTGFANQDFKSKSRVVLESLPRPVGFQSRVNLNAKRVVDAAALSQGLLRSLLK